ncbi:CIA30 family protein [Candidatus Epulonipiscium viviparus]|uniref:CIA30 family protein n=1 Tax=Candidatus Epulonipiscium viviparus TaxID=420336 RepID=UPI00016C01F4|nr:CIA30 family protein [Candidatus Epulopiscium viviparus]
MMTLDHTVQITSLAGTPEKANLSYLPDSVSLADKQATPTTRAAAAFLRSLSAANQTLFGHQNDLTHCVYSNAAGGSDVKEITGTYAGLVGFDAATLTGSEIEATSLADAFAKSVEVTKKAASEGALITLSVYPPNFTDSRFDISDGEYDYFGASFIDSKNLSGNPVAHILPGGKLNDKFNTYLDIIVQYASAIGDIPVLFRPFPKNNGGWFWWGSALSVNTYKSLYRYTVDYLKDNGVHNFLYVYSPNGPFDSIGHYLEKFPGDDYVDIMAFNYYCDYSIAGEQYNTLYINTLQTSCKILAEAAMIKDKIPALSETGASIRRADGSKNGLDITNNPIANQNFFANIFKIAQECGLAYTLLWANFTADDFFIPFKYNATSGHEMINEFIDLYNTSGIIFAAGTNFYDTTHHVEATLEPHPPTGYLLAPHDMQTILKPTMFIGVAQNATEVEFMISDSASGIISFPATINEDGLYTVTFSEDDIASIIPTNTADISLLADGKLLGQVSFISIGKERPSPPQHIFENFEYYFGYDEVVRLAYGDSTAAAGSSASFNLYPQHEGLGQFMGQLNYTLDYRGTTVWAGFVSGKKIKISGEFNYNALSMWIQPDGYGQKFVVQLSTAQEEFETELTDFMKTTEAKYITIPFDQFIGQRSGKPVNPAEIKSIQFWFNSVFENVASLPGDGLLSKQGDHYILTSFIFIDDITAIKVEPSLVSNAPVISDEPLVQHEVLDLSLSRELSELQDKISIFSLI